MGLKSRSEISIWIDRVQTPVQEITPLPTPFVSPQSDDTENLYTAIKKRRAMQDDHDQTPRPLKRIRDLNDAARLPPPSPASVSSEADSDTLELQSHKSGRLSPIKQLQLLEDFEDQPVVFYNFEDDKSGAAPDNVSTMRQAIQRFADGIGILAYDHVDQVTLQLSPMDRARFQYPWATDPEQRFSIGSMPAIEQVADIVQQARKHDRGAGSSEDDWNSDVQHPLLKLACKTGKHSRKLLVVSVKTAKIEPSTLSRSRLPGRIVDYVIALEEDPVLKEAYRHLQPLPGVSIRSWNHTTRVRHNPIAIHVETKSPSKSWTDGRPQIALWTDAWLKRIGLIRGSANLPWPAMPLLIAQGHDWHLLIVSKDDQKMTIWEKISIGSTRSCFDAMKVIASLHWLMDWAETVWRPWFLSILPT